jgi:hypothetical protein
MPSLPHRRLVLPLLALLVAAIPALSQANTPEPEPPIHTLRVYMDLVQVPVLVLDSEQGRMKPVDPTKFLVSLDSGKPFRPRLVRQQGEDPITLGILLDPNAEPDLMPRISAALASLATASLRPKDHVSLFVLDCNLLHPLDDAPASRETLQAATDSALSTWLARRAARHPDKRAVPPCAARVHLWDAMGYAARLLSKSPGRRVLLAVTDGQDDIQSGASKTPPDDLRHFAQAMGVAIFGYSTHYAPTLQGAVSSISSRSPRTIAQVSTGTTNAGEDPFSTICQLTGGVVLPANSSYLPLQLTRFTTMLRERYIVEFARPRNGEPGVHSIVVSIPKVDSRAFIRPAGVTILGVDHSLDTADDVIRRDATDAPELGKAKPYKH